MDKMDIWRGIALAVFWLIACVLTICALTSCAAPKVVTVTEYRSDVRHDTLRAVDSVYVAHYLMQKGDTIFKTDTICQYRILTKTRDVYVHDSIPYVVEVVKEVRVRNGYDRFTARGFWVLVVLLIVAAGGWIGSKTPYGKMATAIIRGLFR